MEPDLLDIDEACRLIGGTRPIHPSTLWRAIRAGRFSRPIRIGAQAVRWRRSELQADIERIIAERDRKAAS